MLPSALRYSLGVWRADDSTARSPEPIEIVSFPVEGMTCASCVNRITRFLQKVDGVEDATVNLAAESATVRFDPGGCGSATSPAAVEAAGYVARVERAASSRSRRRRGRGRGGPRGAGRGGGGTPGRVRRG